ncbi:Uncharacterised protein [uncultured archaeon]|nr:Uncharacterised protein [uncultured archaeon]
MQIESSMRAVTSAISWHLEGKESRKFTRRVAYSLLVFLSIWFETTTEVDTLKIRKKGLSRNDSYLLF